MKHVFLEIFALCDVTFQCRSRSSSMSPLAKRCYHCIIYVQAVHNIIHIPYLSLSLIISETAYSEVGPSPLPVENRKFYPLTPIGILY